jgi:hypothetical protein
MKFEVSEQIRCLAEKRAVLDSLELQFRKISRTVERTGEAIRVRNIEASFGSINRSDETLVRVQQKNNGALCVAEVTYRPSVAFWIFFILVLFTYLLLWWIPILFYLTQKKTVRNAIVDVFLRVKNEFEIDSTSWSADLDRLEKLTLLKEKGVLSDAEFDNQKRELSLFAQRPESTTENSELTALREAEEKRRITKLRVLAGIVLLFIVLMAYALIVDRGPSPAVIQNPNPVSAH